MHMPQYLKLIFTLALGAAAACVPTSMQPVRRHEMPYSRSTPSLPTKELPRRAAGQPELAPPASASAFFANFGTADSRWPASSTAEVKRRIDDMLITGFLSFTITGLVDGTPTTSDRNAKVACVAEKMANFAPMKSQRARDFALGYRRACNIELLIKQRAYDLGFAVVVVIAEPLIGVKPDDGQMRGVQVTGSMQPSAARYERRP